MKICFICLTIETNISTFSIHPLLIAYIQIFIKIHMIKSCNQSQGVPMEVGHLIQVK